jgi:hypothetical protein
MKEMKETKKNQVLVDAALVASDQLTREGVAHCLVGKLGMASHGFDVGQEIHEIEMLVDASEAFSQGEEGMVLTKAALPLSVGEIRVKWNSFDKDWETKLWSKELMLVDDKSGSVPLAPLSLVMCFMMMSGDEASVSAALKDGASGIATLSILSKHQPRLASRLSAMIEAVEAGGA